jgi:hypothetical protein
VREAIASRSAIGNILGGEWVPHVLVSIPDAKALLAAYQSVRGDKARLDWLQSEEERVGRVASICVKRDYDRESSEWVNIVGDVRTAIDRARTGGTE